MPRNDAVQVSIVDVIHAAILNGQGAKTALIWARLLGIKVRDEAFYRRFREETEWLEAALVRRRSGAVASGD